MDEDSAKWNVDAEALRRKLREALGPQKAAENVRGIAVQLAAAVRENERLRGQCAAYERVIEMLTGRDMKKEKAE